MTFLSQLDWRWATKSFDSNKPVTKEQLATVLKAIKMAPTSFGLQPFRVYVIANEEIKLKLSESAFGQPQPKQAPYTLVFCADREVLKRLDSYINLSANGDEEVIAKLQDFKQMVQGMVGSVDAQSRTAWASKQAYIALGFAIAACSELGLDSCPMEGFTPPSVNQALNLPEHLQSIAMLAIGYRNEEPSKPKFRFPDEELFVRVV